MLNLRKNLVEKQNHEHYSFEKENFEIKQINVPTSKGKVNEYKIGIT